MVEITPQEYNNKSKNISNSINNNNGNDNFDIINKN